MKSKFSRLLPPAITAIEDTFKAESIPAEYQGYISSFGATVMQMGLLPTLAVFASEKEDGAAQDQSALLDILYKVVCSDASRLEDRLKNQLKAAKTKDQAGHFLFRAAVSLANNEADLRALRAHLMDAAIAVKLSIRTFKLTRDE